MKPLPEGYKHKYCEACRNQHAQKVKNGLKAAAGLAGTAACFAVTIVTAGKINLKNKMKRLPPSPNMFQW